MKEVAKMRSTLVLLAVIVYTSAVTYKGSQSLKVGRKTYKCNFNIDYTLSPPKCVKKKVNCRPNPKKEIEFSSIETKDANLTLSVTKNKVTACEVGPTLITPPENTRQKNLLYSWARMWSGECNKEEFARFDESSTCFTHPWDTAAKRQKLWCTCNRPGREIGTLFLYSIAEITKKAMAYGDFGCDSGHIAYIRQTLAEGHKTVKDLQIYALLSWGGADVPEKDLVPSLVWYNQHCAQTQDEKLDGVAVNNEDFNKHGTEKEKVAYLQNLAMIALNAGGELKTHYSFSWNWFEAGNVTFNRETKNVVMHMIDIFDSTDMQTAYILGQIMVDRLQKGFNGDVSSPPNPDGLNSWSYSKSQGKMMFATLYLSRIESLAACPTTFFPRPECAGTMGWNVVAFQTEQKMWEEVDNAKSLLDGFTPSLHFYGGVYNSGGHPDWPNYC